jgi:hypothetical protein
MVAWRIATCQCHDDTRGRVLGGRQLSTIASSVVLHFTFTTRPISFSFLEDAAFSDLRGGNCILRRTEFCGIGAATTMNSRCHKFFRTRSYPPSTELVKQSARSPMRPFLSSSNLFWFGPNVEVITCPPSSWSRSSSMDGNHCTNFYDIIVN